METVRWALAACGAFVFLWVSGLNWYTFYQGWIRRMPTPSWIPLLAGASGAIALWVAPTGTAHLWWLPLILDFGSAPGLLFSLACWVLGRNR